MDRTETTATLVPRLIALDVHSGARQAVLEGPPGTVTMRSGLVSLEPGDSVGRHRTESYEEVLIVLEGAGVMRFTAHETLPLQAPCAAYCPPETEHDVTNTGRVPLRYVYVVAHAGRSHSI